MTRPTTHYVEMRSEAELVPTRVSDLLQVRECEVKQWRVNRFLYGFVGELWQWTDRLIWTDDQWRDYAENDDLRTWVGYVQGSPAGYFELQRQAGGDVEIVLFGLASPFIGQGLGGDLLSRTLQAAWSWGGTRRVWLHTCAYDHPNALTNYLARGMTVYRVDEEA